MTRPSNSPSLGSYGHDSQRTAVAGTRVSGFVGTVVLLWFAIAPGCSSDSIPSAELISTYADVIVARSTGLDSAQVQKKIDSVLAEHGYDSLEFFEALRSMSASPELFKSFYDSVSTQLRAQRDSIRAAPSAAPASP